MRTAKIRGVNTLLLCDGNALIHRAYHAMPGLTTPEKKPIGAVYGVISMLLKVVLEVKPTHIVFAFDRPEPTFRQKLSAEYQAQRPEVEHDLISQFALVREALTAMGIVYFEKPGYEADDIIGTLSRTFNGEVIIVTGDRDILQLVDERVKVLLPISGMANTKIFHPTDVTEKMGVGPDKIVFYKALVGDPSDNYKGVPGIGPKTAQKLIETYKDLDDVYAHIDDVEPKIAAKLMSHKESAYLSWKLATIIRDVPLEYNEADWQEWSFGSPKVVSAFTAFGFKSLTERALAAEKKLQKDVQPALL